MVSCDVTDPPEGGVTLPGLNEVAIPDGALADRVTVPVNPPVLVTLIVTLVPTPAIRWLMLDGLALMVKSPVS
jgi:hypothetical protein